MADEFVPAKEDPVLDTAPVVETSVAQSPAQKAFIDETRELFEKMEGKKEPEEVKPAEEPPPKQDTGFIPDFSKATPEDFKKRIDWLYAQKKDQERQWAEARTYIQKQEKAIEELRRDREKESITRSEAELDAEQVRVVNLLNPSHPDYNPKDGAQLLRELTNRDQELRDRKKAEAEKAKAFEAEREQKSLEANQAEVKRVVDEWAADRPYTRKEHPMFPQVAAWIQKAYQEAPPHVTVEQIVKRAGEIFDPAYTKQKSTSQPPPLSAGAGGERLTVSSVIGSRPPPSKSVNPGDSLTPQQRAVAEKLFHNPEQGVSRAQAYEKYAKGL